MKLIDVSNASLNKIYDCLSKKKSRATANFARTNCRFAKFAIIENRIFNKIECDEVSMRYDIEKNVIDPAILINHRFETFHEIPTRGSLKKAMSTVMQFFTQTHSFRRFRISLFIVNEEFLATIRENLKPSLKCGVLEDLTFAYCQLECSTTEFFDTIAYLKIKRLNMDEVVLKQNRINNTHLSISPMEIVIFPLHNEHCDVNDQMLTNLFYETNKNVCISSLRTQVTLQALLDFIEKMVTKMNKSSMKFKHELSVGDVKADSYSRYQLVLAQRIPELTWEAVQYETKRHEIQYKVTHDKYDFEIAFSVTTVECPKITKRQARRRIDALREKIRNNFQENDAYRPTEDMKVMIEVQHLQGGMFDDWTELQDAVYRLQYTEMDETDEEDSEDDDDQE